MFGWLNAPAADPGDRRHFVVDACADCGHGLTRDPPEGSPAELHATGGYASARPRLASVAAPILRLYDRAKLRLLRRTVPDGGRVLEVGAGRGRFVARLTEAGFDASGIEPAPARVVEARAAGGAVWEAAIEEADIEARSLDAVVAWHVIEHTRDPDRALARIAEWLKPGGTALIAVPNRAGWQAGIGQDNWFHLDLPRHVSHFTPRSLTLLMERHGLETRVTRHVGLEHNPFGMWQTLVSSVTFDANVFFGLLKRSLRPRGFRARARATVDLLVTLIVGLPALVVAIPLELLAGLARRGGTIAVLAVRSGEGAESAGQL